jgi:hypothetical protein
MNLNSGLLAATVACMCACTAAQLTAFDQAIEQGQSALVPAENLACEAAMEFDPTGKTAVCSIIDATGTAVGDVINVIEDAQSIAALVRKAAPKNTATAAKLKTAAMTAPRGGK